MSRRFAPPVSGLLHFFLTRLELTSDGQRATVAFGSFPFGGGWDQSCVKAEARAFETLRARLRSTTEPRLRRGSAMRSPRRPLITTASLLTAVLATAAPTAAQADAYAPTYLDPIDLGTLGGSETRAYAANGARIVGASQTVDGLVHAFKYEDGALTDLGTLGGSTSWAFAVNTAGAVAGSASLPDDVTHAFLWTEEIGMLDLGTLGGTYSRGSGINDAGQVSGWAQVAGDTSYHAFLWDPTTGMRDLGTFGGDTSAAYDVGTVACGEAETVDGARHAFVTSVDGLTDLGTLGGTYSAAINCSIEPSGRGVLGESSVSDDTATHAVSWSDRVISDLGTLGGTESRALRASQGQIFGESRTVEGDLHPVRWWPTNFFGRLADFAHVLGADSQIELIVPAGSQLVISGAASPGADVHAYIVSVPGPFDSSTSRTINDGVIEVLRLVEGEGRFAFTTEDATADVTMAGGLFSRCDPCGPGSLVSLSYNVLVGPDAFGSATVRGNEYTSQYGIPMPEVQLTITADDVTIPTTGDPLITLTVPFMYSGFVLGALAYEWRGQPDLLFGLGLRGAGTATFQVRRLDSGIYEQVQLKYVFEPQ